MGFLYSWNLILQDQIPSLNDFDAMRRIIMRDLNNNSNVVAASIYGSVMRGDYNSRSDLDLAVVCRNDKIAKTHRFVQSLRAKAFKRHVVLSVHVHTVSEARAGNHPFGPSYLVTMRDAYRHKEFVKGIPQQYFFCKVTDVRSEMEDKLARYILLLKKQASKFDHMAYNAVPENVARVWLASSYQAGIRPFHFYISFARWMLWWHQGLVDDSKKAVVDAFLAEKSFRHLHADFRSLRERDLAYDVLFARVRAGEILKVCYHREVYYMVATVYTIAVRLFERAITFMRREPIRKREQERLLNVA